MISDPTFGVGGQMLRDKEEYIKIIGRKRKRRIRKKRGEGYLYGVLPMLFCLYPCLFYYDYTNSYFFLFVFGILCTRDKEFKKYWISGFKP